MSSFSTGTSMITSLLGHAVVSGAFYGISEVLNSYNSATSNQALAAEQANPLSSYVGQCIRSSRNILGERAWTVITRGVGDNLWASYLAYAVLTSGRTTPTHIGTHILAMSFMFSLSTGIYFARYAIAYTFPDTLGKYIGARDYYA
jgi:hypothetical protein